MIGLSTSGFLCRACVKRYFCTVDKTASYMYCFLFCTQYEWAGHVRNFISRHWVEFEVPFVPGEIHDLLSTISSTEGSSESAVRNPSIIKLQGKGRWQALWKSWSKRGSVRVRGGDNPSYVEQRAGKGESGRRVLHNIGNNRGVTSAHTKDGGSLYGGIVGIFRFPRTGCSADSVNFARWVWCIWG